MSTMRLTLKVWRQASPDAAGEFRTYPVDADEHMSFLEMLDVVNEGLIATGGGADRVRSRLS